MSKSFFQSLSALALIVIGSHSLAASKSTKCETALNQAYSLKTFGNETFWEQVGDKVIIRSATGRLRLEIDPLVGKQSHLGTAKFVDVASGEVLFTYPGFEPLVYFKPEHEGVRFSPTDDYVLLNLGGPDPVTVFSREKRGLVEALEYGKLKTLELGERTIFISNSRIVTAGDFSDGIHVFDFIAGEFQYSTNWQPVIAPAPKPSGPVQAWYWRNIVGEPGPTYGPRPLQDAASVVFSEQKSLALVTQKDRNNDLGHWATAHTPLVSIWNLQGEDAQGRSLPGKVADFDLSAIVGPIDYQPAENLNYRDFDAEPDAPIRTVRTSGRAIGGYLVRPLSDGGFLVLVTVISDIYWAGLDVSNHLSEQHFVVHVSAGQADPVLLWKDEVAAKSDKKLRFSASARGIDLILDQKLLTRFDKLQ